MTSAVSSISQLRRQGSLIKPPCAVGKMWTGLCSGHSADTDGRGEVDQRRGS
jgi:hypothetical protein